MQTPQLQSSNHKKKKLLMDLDKKIVVDLYNDSRSRREMPPQVCTARETFCF